MSYLSDVQIFLPFDQSVVEMVSGVVSTAIVPTHALITREPTIPNYSPAIFNQGLNLNGTTLTLDALSGLTDEFTIGFWLESTNPGMVTNPNTGATESLKMPLLSKAFFYTNQSTQVTTATWNKFIIWEETQSDGTNVLQISISGTIAAPITAIETQHGSLTQNEKQTITFTPSTSGTYTIGFNRSLADLPDLLSAPISYNGAIFGGTNTTNLQAGMDSITGLNTDTLVTYVSGTTYQIEFINALSNNAVEVVHTYPTGMTGLPVTATLTSSPYTTGMFHHFWIVYDGASLNLYVDMILDSGSALSGTIPETLNISTSLFGINMGLAGNGYNTAFNSGILDDLVIFNTARSDVNDINRAITLGAAYVADVSLMNDDEVSQAIVFDDSTTIEVTSMFGNRGNVYAGRSDGKILKGTRVLWESRRDFSNSDEINFITVITRSTTDNLTIEGGILNITNAILRV